MDLEFKWTGLFLFYCLAEEVGIILIVETIVGIGVNCLLVKLLVGATLLTEIVPSIVVIASVIAVSSAFAAISVTSVASVTAEAATALVIGLGATIVITITTIISVVISAVIVVVATATTASLATISVFVIALILDAFTTAVALLACAEEVTVRPVNGVVLCGGTSK